MSQSRCIKRFGFDLPQFGIGLKHKFRKQSIVGEAFRRNCFHRPWNLKPPELAIMKCKLADHLHVRVVLKRHFRKRGASAETAVVKVRHIVWHNNSLDRRSSECNTSDGPQLRIWFEFNFHQLLARLETRMPIVSTELGILSLFNDELANADSPIARNALPLSKFRVSILAEEKHFGPRTSTVRGMQIGSNAQEQSVKHDSSMTWTCGLIKIIFTICAWANRSFPRTRTSNGIVIVTGWKPS
jgi:hypothetical protein